MIERSKSLYDTEKIAERFVNSIPKQNVSGAFVVGLTGDLGSCKTTFVKGVAKALKIKEVVTSPTFIIEKIYKISANKNFDYLIHIDAYRIEDPDEILALGFMDILKNAKNLIIIEWPEIIKKILPKETKIIYFKFIDEETREITI